MNLKELETAFIKTVKADEANYVNYLIGELNDGQVVFVKSCKGHKTLYEALSCKDKQASPDELTKCRAVSPLIKNFHIVVVKETTIVEFLE